MREKRIWPEGMPTMRPIISRREKDTVITITKGEKSVKASQLMKIMSLAAKNGDEVTDTVEGPEEDAAFEAVKCFFEANL